ncbi:MAG: hypothetical protein JJU09_03575 [Rhodobacteraceae bacterium]|nr:hypothetical protein [Paracoccaceae bacterium]TVR43174.1 MAG: hypothetical protein EA386_16055 [Paracoccaceae bacterium]
MAAFRSTRRGDRHLRWHDWLIGYGVVWLAPVLLGLLMVLPFLPCSWLSEAIGRKPPRSDALAQLAGHGMVVALMPMLTWLGLLPSAPLVWLVMRRGLGGWMSFALGGVACALLAARMLEGIPPAIPVGTGLVSALALRAVLGRRRPEAFIPAPR